MKRLARHILTALALALVAMPASAACYADYKATMRDANNQLRLHYGVIEIPQNQCSVGAAFDAIAPRVAAGGWELREVMTIFDESGLDARRTDAGQFYLAF